MQFASATLGGTWLAALLAVAVAAPVAWAQAEPGAKPAAKPAAPAPAAKPQAKPAPPTPEQEKPSTGVPDVPDHVGRTYTYQRFILRSKGKESHFFRVGHDRGKLLRPLLESLMKYHGIQGVVVDTVEAEHLLVITGAPENVRWVRALLEGLDKPDDQVVIEAVIVEIEVGSGLETGLESTWDRKTSDRTFFRGYDATFNPESFLSATSSQPFQGAGGNFSTKGSPSTQAKFGDLDLALRAVATRNRVDVLSRPRAVVLNGKKATLSSGVKVLIPKSVSISTSGQPTTQLELQPVETSLIVTPHILGRHTIALTVTLTVQDLLRETPADQIKTSERKIVTDVVVNEGDYLALGGLLRRRTLVQERGLPILSDIPLLGLLFKSYTRSNSTTELSLYIRARIQRNDRFGDEDTLIDPTDLDD